MKTTILVLACAAFTHATAQTTLTNSDSLITGPSFLRNNPSLGASYVSGADRVISNSSVEAPIVITEPTNIVVGRTPFSRSSQQITVETNGEQVVVRTNAHTEIGYGITHIGAQGHLVDSSDQIQILSGGGAAATNAGHQAYFPGDIYSDTFQVITPDSKTLTYRPLGLAYADGQSSAFIAELREGSSGQLQPSGAEIVFSNICADVELDLRAIFKISGYESDVIIREQLPDPGDYGFSNNVVLQWWTEFFNPPGPNQVPHSSATGLPDADLDFGELKMLQGKAFLLGNEGPGLIRLPVTKQWVTIDDRTFLVESVPLAAVASRLQTLPPRTAALTPHDQEPAKLIASRKTLPLQRPTRHSATTISLARNPAVNHKGFVLDFNLTGALTNFTLQSGVTYVVSNAVTFYGVTIIEPNCIVKLAPTNASLMYIKGSLRCLTGPFRMAVFTSVNDDSVGARVPGSTGSPEVSDTIYFDFEPQDAELRELNYVRIKYALGGFIAYDAGDMLVRNCQFLRCTYAAGVVFTGNITVENTLFSACDYPVYGNEHVAAVNATSSGHTNFCEVAEGLFGLAVTNCVLAGPGQILGVDAPSTNLPTPILDHSSIASNSAGAFQSIGGGNYYLLASTNRDSATTNIRPALLAELRQKTTFPPVLWTNITIGSTNLLPTAARDTTELDRGFHYDPLDYLIARMDLNGTLLLTNGTAIGFYGTVGDGIYLTNGSTFISEGTATELNRLVWYGTVQEETSWRGNEGSILLSPGDGSSATLKARFTEFSRLPGTNGPGDFLSDIGAGGFIGSYKFQDCFFWAGGFTFRSTPYELGSEANLTLKNCQFSRTAVELVGQSDYLNVFAYNTLFFGGTLTLNDAWEYFTTYILMRDSVLDRPGYTLSYSVSLDMDYNAYWLTNSESFWFNDHELVLTNISYSTGPLGIFYQQTTNIFTDHGSRRADQAGLYHYTILTNQVKEAASTNDLGFHYVACGTNGLPADSDGDGVFDYVEDRNGNGVFDPVTDLDDWLDSSPHVFLCRNAPTNLVAWWRAEGNANDETGAHNGTLTNGVTFVPGAVGQAFYFDGISSYVRIPANPSLGFSNELTIELWYSAEGRGNQGLVARRNNEAGPLNYEVGVVPAVQILGFFNDPSVSGDSDLGGSFEISQATPAPSAEEFHHLAVSYRQATTNTVELKTYLDGQLVRTRSFTANLGRAVNTNAAVLIGVEAEYPNNDNGWFKGMIDEVSMYNRALTTNEISELYNAGTAGKCALPPAIITQPANTAVAPGANAYFSVIASGALPLAFQWRFNGTNLAGTTGALLTISSVQSNNVGDYSVVVTNVYGSVTSGVATLSLNYPFVLLTNPPTLSSFGGRATIPLQAIATNFDNSITNVEFYRSPVRLGTDAAAPYSFTWTNVPAGVYTLTAVAWGSNGLSSTSSPITLTVTSACEYTNNTYSSNNAFGGGLIENLNYTNSFGRLQLNSQAAPFKFLNLPCGLQGTVIRFDTSTGQAVGEYRICPQGKPAFSGHTTVDRYGNAWVADWDEAGQKDGTNKGSVTRIGLVIGGTRGDIQTNGSGQVTNFVANTNGLYLQPPFVYSTAIDRNGDGYIKTSRGMNNVLNWPSNSAAGSVLDAEDECIINYVRVPAQLVSLLALDTNNDLWVGGYCNHETEDYPGQNEICSTKLHVKVDGVTGLVLTNTAVIFTNSGTRYGGFEGLVTTNGVLWSSGGANACSNCSGGSGNYSLVRYNPAGPSTNIIDDNKHYFGMAIDPQTGNVWVTGFDNTNVFVFSPSGTNGTPLATYYHGDAQSGGLAIDNSGNVWVAHGPWNGTGSTVGHLRTDGNFLENVDISDCAGVSKPSTVAIDADGMVWAICASQSGASPNLVRITPNAGAWATNANGIAFRRSIIESNWCIPVPDHSNRESYGDFTGQRALAGTAPSGVWSVVYTNGLGSQQWGSLTWNASTSDTNQIRVEVRAAEEFSQLSTNLYQLAQDSVFLSNVSGKYLEIRVTLLLPAGQTNSPWLHDLTFDCIQNIGPTVQITSPISQTIMAETNLLIMANAFSQISSVRWVQFFEIANGHTNSLGFAFTNSPYAVPWRPILPTNYVFRALVQDDRGSNAWSALVTNTVRALPTVTITNPLANAVFTNYPTNIAIGAIATASGATVTNVVFYRGTNVLGAAVSNGNNSYGFLWNNVITGTFFLRAKAKDTNGAVGVSHPVSITVLPTNATPRVYAGPGQTVNLWQTNVAWLQGAAADDGFPAGALSTVWRLTNGPANVVFGNSNQPKTTVQFSQTGTYLLELSASDTAFTRTSSVAILVISNLPPVVNAGPDQVLAGFKATQLQGTAADDGQPNGILLAYWSVIDGPGTVVFGNANATNTLATFGTIGAYHLQLSASDGLLTSSSTVLITITESNTIPYQATNWLYVFDDGSDSLTNFYGLGFDANTWTNAQGGFGNYAQCYYCEIFSESNVTTTYWPGACGQAGKLLLRHWFNIPPGATNLAMGFTVDNNAQIYLNGILVTNGASVCNGYFDPGSGWFYGDNCPAYDALIITNFDSALWHEGTNLLAVRVVDNEAFCFFDSRIAINTPIQCTPPANRAPKVTVNANGLTTNSVQLHGWALDDGRPGNGQAVALWTNVSGPGSVTFVPNPPLLSFTNLAHVEATATFGTAGTYVLRFLADDSELVASNDVIITVSGGAVPPPTVALIAPTNNSIYPNGAVITLQASASASAGTITNLELYATTSSGDMLIGRATNTPFSLVWSPPAAGVYVLWAAATESGGRVGYSSTAQVQVLPAPPQLNHWPFATNDEPIVLANSHNNILHVLTNDFDSDGDQLTISAILDAPHNGTATIVGNRTAISYTPDFFIYGSDALRYQISDGRGGFDQAVVSIKIDATGIPGVQIIDPANGPAVSAGTVVPIAAKVEPFENVTKVEFFLGGTSIGVVSNGVNGFYTNNWTALYDNCGCDIRAQATDKFGQVSLSDPIHVTVTISPSLGVPIAAIDNLVAPVTNNVDIQLTNLATIREGLFDLYGRADHSKGSNVTWQVALYNPDGSIIRQVTNSTTRVTTSNLLAHCDFSTLQNGVYELRLTVAGGYAETNSSIRFRLESNLKIGQFSFSQQDLVIPVNGIPLTVVRTYSSLNPARGDFGYGWTYALMDMNVEIDEDREDATDIDGEVFSQRVGGGRDVTLTLPNGQRTTFYFNYRAGAIGRYYAEWIPAPGVTAKLSPKDDNTLQGIFGISSEGKAYWQADAYSLPMDNFDFSGFTLETLDGTKYIIQREDLEDHPMDDGSLGYFVHAWGKPHLARIEQRAGDKIEINPDSIVHRNPTNGITRQVTFQRNDNGLITAIFDPISQLSSTNVSQPSVIYEYDANQNLITVAKLVDRTGAGTYVTNSFTYTNGAFPHYITGIIDPLGTTVTRNEYDDSGRLTAIVDADGYRTDFRHDLNSKTETHIDRMGYTNVFTYNLRGNIIAATNAVSGITLSAYDDNNNKTNESQFLDGQPYASNRFVFDTNNLLLVGYNPLGYSNVYTYNSRGQTVTSLRRCGCNGATNYYDASTGNLIASSDALGNASTNFYDSATGLLLGARDPLGTSATNSYDATGNLIGTAVLDAAGAILSTNSFSYDPNGNQTNSVVWRRVNGAWVGATNSCILDGQNRAVQTINAIGAANTTVYDAVGRQVQSVDALGRTTRFEFDTKGRLTRTTYPDLTTTTTAYDPSGNRTNSVDQLGQVTTYAYDGLGRQIMTIFSDAATTRTVYDELGQVKFMVDSRGTTNSFGYDAAGQRVAVTNALGTDVQSTNGFIHDLEGNQIATTDALGHTTTNVVDALGRLVQKLFVDGTRTLIGYDSAGRRVAETNQDGIVTRFGYDGLGRLVSVTDALGGVTSFAYDEAGNGTNQVDAVGRRTAFEFDSIGRPVTRTLPGGQVEQMLYDLMGNLILKTNFNGTVITNRYDELNRLTNRASVHGYRVSFAFSPTGQRAKMLDASGESAYTYDRRNRLVEKMTAWDGGPMIYLKYGYDRNGNVTNISSTSSEGAELRYKYDALNRLTNVMAGGAAVAKYAFDANGNLASSQYANGTTNMCQYDRLNRLTNSIWKSNSLVLASFYCQVGATGKRTNLTETLISVVTNRTYNWSYDSAYRLTSESISDLGILAYGLDPVGNRTNRFGSGGITNALPATTNSYSANDWLDTAAYDPGGNTLWMTNGATAIGPYYYDVEDRLTNFNDLVHLSYNGDGLLVKRVAGGTNVFLLIDDRNPTGFAQVLEEWTVGAGATNLSCVYNWGFALVSQLTLGSQPSTNYVVYDAHGSTRLLIDEGCIVTSAMTYDAFGNLVASNGPPQTSIRYCGQQFDPVLGSYYLRARTYDPSAGRFPTADTKDGTHMEPLSFNRYLYCLGDPVNRTDPSGHGDTNLFEGQTAFGVTDGGWQSDTAAVSAAEHLLQAGWNVRMMDDNEFAQTTNRFQGLISGGHGDAEQSGPVRKTMLENMLNRNGDKLRVLIALSCHSVDFASPLAQRGYTTSDALIICYRGYNFNDLLQTRRICKVIDKWAKNPTFTFEVFGHSIADGGAIVGGAAVDIMGEAPDVSEVPY